MINEARVLVVDDEEDIRDLVSFHLEKAGFKVLTAGDGTSALSLLWDEPVDLMILDVMMPGQNGLEVLKTLREDKRTRDLPVILLTAKTTETDRIVGFQMGTDDYVCKPFSVKELMARVKALLRRSSGEEAFTAEGFSVDFSSHRITVEGKPVEFSAREFAILETLFKRKNKVIGREQLLEKVWGMDSSVDGRAVDVNITRMREKMGKAKDLIRTVKGYGYMFDASLSGGDG